MHTEQSRGNSRPTGTSNLPAITLAVLVLMILALLYIGYEYIRDDTGGSEALTNVQIDTTGQQPIAMQTEPELLAPEEVSSASADPAPVDLSQETPPAEAVTPTDEKKEVKPAPTASTEAAKPVGEKPKEEEKPAVVKPVTVKAGGTSYSHTVAAGETLFGVATRYSMSVNTLKAMNPGVSESDVKAGITKLNVKVKAVHTVGPGDVLRVVAQKYGVTVNQLMKANKKDRNFAQRGEKLIIPFPDKQ
ncbi:hypothetical protein GCM10023189_30690 [Nibrella saemangeumensis]|uniref:LysM domain-containing protein n=1 Tax=Nibrella saemangeumensis TaxID=1084526 RepID=A0ABP8N1B8_9BACT